MKIQSVLIIVLCLSGCGQTISSDKVFSNAQIQYQAREEKKALSNKRAMEMPSYFLDLEYEPSQITLNKTQVHKIDSMLRKIVYPEEYKLYISFGVGDDESQLGDLALIYKRARDIKQQCSKKIKNIKIAYLKNQKSDSVYLRLLV